VKLAHYFRKNLRRVAIVQDWEIFDLAEAARGLKFSKFKDVKINGLAHLEALLERYAKGAINPSLRENETLDELLGEKNDE